MGGARIFAVWGQSQGHRMIGGKTGDALMASSCTWGHVGGQLGRRRQGRGHRGTATHPVTSSNDTAQTCKTGILWSYWHCHVRIMLTTRIQIIQCEAVQIRRNEAFYVSTIIETLAYCYSCVVCRLSDGMYIALVGRGSRPWFSQT